LLATGAVGVLVVVVVLAMVSFRVEVLQWWFPGDVGRIQGKWKVVSFKSHGRYKKKYDCVFFEGKTFSILEHDGDEGSGVYHLEENHKPGWIDLFEKDDDEPRRGIYEVKGDTLRICHGNRARKRSTMFESKPGSPDDLWVLQRE